MGILTKLLFLFLKPCFHWAKIKMVQMGQQRTCLIPVFVWYCWKTCGTTLITWFWRFRLTMQHDVDDLKRQNNHLEAQIRALERAKSLGNFSSVADILNESGLVRLWSEFSKQKLENESWEVLFFSTLKTLRVSVNQQTWQKSILYFSKIKSIKKLLIKQNNLELSYKFL